MPQRAAAISGDGPAASQACFARWPSLRSRIRIQVEPFELAVWVEVAFAQLNLSASLTQVASADTVRGSDAPLSKSEKPWQIQQRAFSRARLPPRSRPSRSSQKRSTR